MVERLNLTAIHPLWMIVEIFMTIGILAIFCWLINQFRWTDKVLFGKIN